jgi:cation-transporting P-type ATPase 13A2
MISTKLFNIRGRLKRVCKTPFEAGLTEKQAEKLRGCYGKGTMEI